MAGAVARAQERAVNFAATNRFPLLRQHTARRLTVEIERFPDATNALVARMAESDDSAVQLDILSGMSQALRGWHKAPVPAEWPKAAAKLARSKNVEIQTLTRELSFVFSDGLAL